MPPFFSTTTNLIVSNLCFSTLHPIGILREGGWFLQNAPSHYNPPPSVHESLLILEAEVQRVHWAMAGRSRLPSCDLYTTLASLGTNQNDSECLDCCPQLLPSINHVWFHSLSPSALYRHCRAQEHSTQQVNNVCIEQRKLRQRSFGWASFCYSPSPPQKKNSPVFICEMFEGVQLYFWQI